MGVHGLWQLLQPAGQQVTLESLRGKVLAVDVSVWLHQSMKGMRDKYGNTVHNAHLQFLFKRVSKLLFYGIKPVFVFDGGVPSLKLQTVAGRRHKREDARVNKERTTKKLLQNVLKHHAVNAVLGTGNQSTVLMPPSQREKDMFELPTLPEADRPLANSVEDDWDDRMFQRQQIFSEFQDLNEIDVESQDFKSLPPEIKHEILSDLRDSQKHNSWANINRLPTDSGDFSAFQVQKLMKQSKLSRKLETVRKELNTCHSSNVDELLSDTELASQITSNKVVSDDSTHYILVKRLSPVKNSGEKEDGKRELELKVEKDSCDTCDGVKPIKQEETVEDTGDYNIEIHADIAQHSSLRSQLKCTQKVCSTAGENIDFGAKELAPVTLDQEPVRVATEDKDPFETTVQIHSYNTETVESNSEGKTKLLNIEENSEKLSHDVNDGEVLLEKNGAVLNANIRKRFTEPSSSDECIKKKLKLDRLTNSSDSDKSITVSNKPSETNTPTVSVPLQSNVTDMESKEAYSSEDDGSDFLEVTINPEKIESDNLFPASLFIPASDITDTKEQHESDLDRNDLGISSGVSIEIEDSTDYVSHEREDSNSSTNFKSHFKDLTENDLESIQTALDEESAALIKEQGTQERLATSITDQMQKESQELLILFGVPFVVAPMEAEAQCAFLDLTSQTQGTITDDSDIWLFGGRKVYRNFFNQNKYVEVFSNKDIEDRLLLTRDQMVKLAYLCGCDYTDGIQGVGPVTGMEVLLEFPGEELDGLISLKNWWNTAHKQVQSNKDTKLKTKLKALNFGEGFPNPAVYQAFMEPVVDESTDEFTWGNPDLDLLREFAYDKLGWTKAKVDEIILPVVKEMNKTGTQTSITSFFNTESVSKSPVKSKRVNRVLTRMKDQTVSVKSKKGKSSKRLPAKNKTKAASSGGWVKDDQDKSDGWNKSLNLSENSSDSE